MIPGWEDVNAAAKDAGALAAYLSGAGPTVMAVYEKQDEGFIHRLEAGLCGLTNRWDVLRLECCLEGATVKRGG
jgi:homoserine kinase